MATEKFTVEKSPSDKDTLTNCVIVPATKVFDGVKYVCLLLIYAGTVT